MKPLKLVMSAFGSYADVQTVDFTKLGNSGLYLIAGETGSGKTTIFDAISFALFGEASGSERNKYQVLRSHFAEEHKRTYVELDLLSGSNLYRIKRVIKNSGQDVVLTLPDGTEINGDRNIKPKIAEIVGLDKEQFSQIVMIAQNDFLKFLKSGTEDRVKILRSIFGTDALRVFQELIKARVGAEKEECDKHLHDFKRYDVDVKKRDEKFAEWEEQILTDDTELTTINDVIQECVKKKDALIAEAALANELNQKYIDLDRFQTNLKEHDAKTEEIIKIRERADRGEKALRKVEPYANTAAIAATAHEAEEAAIITARDKQTTSRAELEQIEETIRNLPSIENEEAALEALKERYTETDTDLTNLRVLKNDWVTIKNEYIKLKDAQSEFEHLNTVFTTTDERYRTLEETYLRNQAGILAKDLSDGVPCPVCGSTDHPSPAVISSENINESKLKQEKAVVEKAQKERNNKSEECSVLNGKIETLTKRSLEYIPTYITDKGPEEKISIFVKLFIDDMEERRPYNEWKTSETELEALVAATSNEAEELKTEKESNEKALKDLKDDWTAAIQKKTDAFQAVKSAGILVDDCVGREKKLLETKNNAQKAYEDTLSANGFTDNEDYMSARVTEEQLTEMKKRVSDHKTAGDQLTRDIERLEKETKDKERPNTEEMNREVTAAEGELQRLNDERDIVRDRLSKTKTALNELHDAAIKFEKAEEVYAVVKQLSDAANNRQLDFETYVQITYFERVILAANMRLKIMSQNRYTLRRKEDIDDARKRIGLELEVFDAYTGKIRGTNTLSGGESFMTSLSLALGLSDVVQQSSGGIRFDAMFIDEGFGSLDTEVLELAVQTLSEMAGNNRIIGIISHVAELGERIDKQIRVEKTNSGSKVTMIV